MKNVKKIILISFISLSLLIPISSFATDLPRTQGTGFPAIQVFTPSPTQPILHVVAGDIIITTYNVIMFSEDETIYYGSDSTNSFPLPAMTPLGVAKNQVETLNISANSPMLIMLKKK